MIDDPIALSSWCSLSAFDVGFFLALGFSCLGESGYLGYVHDEIKI